MTAKKPGSAILDTRDHVLDLCRIDALITKADPVRYGISVMIMAIHRLAIDAVDPQEVIKTALNVIASDFPKYLTITKDERNQK
jgi:hypothetical protein